MESGKQMEFPLLHEVEDHQHQINSKTTGFEVQFKLLSHESWPQIQASLRLLVHKEVEKEIQSLFRNFLPTIPRNFASPDFETESLSVTKLLSAESWAQMKVNLRQVVHEEIESHIRSHYPFLVTSSRPLNFASKSNQLNDQIGLGTMKQLQVALSDIMDLEKNYLVENDSMDGEAHEEIQENMEVGEQTS